MEGAPENFNTPEQLDPRRMFKVRMETQAWLIRDNCQPGEDIDSNVDRWIQENSEEFAKAFDNSLRHDPTILERWGVSEGVETEALMSERMKILADLKKEISKVKEEEGRREAA